MSSLRSLPIFSRDPIRRELVSICELRAWGAYRCENSAPNLTGARVKLRLVSSSEESNDIPSPEPSHISAVSWLFENEQAVHDRVIEAIFKFYPELDRELSQYPGYEPWQVHSPSDLRRLVDLTYIDIFPHTKDSLPYLGFEFECAWDPEHGFQVLMNGFRAVQVYGDVNNTYEIMKDGGGVK